jgi:hypothetical protein
MRNRKKLAVLLKLEAGYFRKRHEYKYHRFSEPKPSGGERYFSNPLGRLKGIQRRIHHLVQRIETPDWVKSGKRGESYISNGLAHLDNDYLRTMDIAQFYDSVSRNRVYVLFRNRFCMAEDIATIMTNLVMDGDKLPTGSPSSQLIAFWSYREMFEEIHTIAIQYKCRFTLYVDDMAFSSVQPIPYSLRADVAGVLHRYGLDAKKQKDRYFGSNDYKVITGFGFKNGTPSAQNRKKREILELYIKLQSGASDVNLASLNGKINAVRQNQPGLFSTLLTFSNIDGCHND